MKTFPFRFAMRALLGLTVLSACSAAVATNPLPLVDAGGATDGSAPVLDAGPSDVAIVNVDKAAQCAASFGSALTAPYGRLDGTVQAILKPGNATCALPNRTHVIVQVKALGEVYRMVVNVLSNSADPDVRFARVSKPLPAPAFAEGWQPTAKLDYVTSFNVHNADFGKVPAAELADKVVDAINLGDEISVYASTSGGNSAHLVHRNKPDADGAIIVAPNSASPRVLMFHFAEQVF
jgi:hypothetical protein